MSKIEIVSDKGQAAVKTFDSLAPGRVFKTLGSERIYICVHGAIGTGYAVELSSGLSYLISPTTVVVPVKSAKLTITE